MPPWLQGQLEVTSVCLSEPCLCNTEIAKIEIQAHRARSGCGGISEKQASSGPPETGKQESSGGETGKAGGLVGPGKLRSSSIEVGKKDSESSESRTLKQEMKTLASVEGKRGRSGEKCSSSKDKVSSRDKASSKDEGSSRDKVDSKNEVTSKDEVVFRHGRKIEEYCLIELLGRGAMANVHSARCSISNSMVAIKMVPKRRLLTDPSKTAQVFAERAALKRLSSPYICQVLCSFQNDQYLFFVLEHLGNTTLADYLVEVEDNINIDIIRFFTAELVGALKHLRTKSVVHGDLKPENIMVIESGHIKLIDFDSAEIVSEASGGGEKSYVCAPSLRSANNCPEFQHNWPADQRGAVSPVGRALCGVGILRSDSDIATTGISSTNIAERGISSCSTNISEMGNTPCSKNMAERGISSKNIAGNSPFSTNISPRAISRTIYNALPTESWIRTESSEARDICFAVSNLCRGSLLYLPPEEIWKAEKQTQQLRARNNSQSGSSIIRKYIHNKKEEQKAVKHTLSCPGIDSEHNNPTEENLHKFARDIWALGCIVYQMFTKKSPFHSRTPAEAIAKIKAMNYRVPPDIPYSARNFISKLLLKDPLSRLGVKDISELTSHPFISEFSIEEL